MNFNIANLSSLPTDYMVALDSPIDIANTGNLDDKQFAHVLRNESKRAEQASIDAKDRHAAERSDRRDDHRDDVERAGQPRHDRPEEDVAAKDDHSNKYGANEHGTDQPRADHNQGDEIRADTAEQHDPTEEQHEQTDGQTDGQSETGQPEQHAEAEPTAEDADSQTDAGAKNDETAQPARADHTAAVENQHRQAMPGLPAAAATGEQAADAARTDAAASINQPKASENLTNLVNQTTPKPMPGTQAPLPGIPDPLANGTLPIPLEKKLNPANFQAEIAGKGDDGGLKLALQAQPQAQTKQPVTPHIRGGQAKHAGDMMPDTLPRPQLHQAAAANAPGQQLSGAPQPSTNPAANVAGMVSSDGAAAIQNLQVSVSPERTSQAELPILTTRTNGNPSPTPPAPQPLAGLPLDGEGKSNLISLGEDGSKSGGNNGTSASMASTAAAGGPKAAVLVQHNATTDVRSPGIQVAMHLSKAAQNGIDRMTIRLDPAELGRVHVKLEVGHDGRTIALVAAERPETLELLQRDARSLERALQQAGLETDSDSLSFSLSQGDQQGGALADGASNGADNGKGGGNDGGNGQSDDGTPTGDGGVLPKVVSNRALDISV